MHPRVTVSGSRQIVPVGMSERTVENQERRFEFLHFLPTIEVVFVISLRAPNSHTANDNLAVKGS